MQAGCNARLWPVIFASLIGHDARIAPSSGCENPSPKAALATLIFYEMGPKPNDTIREIIVKGMRNSLNGFRKSSEEEEKAVADSWIEILGISHLSDKKFSELSSGEQRLVLLARAFAKQPELLVLDETFHGLDSRHKDLSKISFTTFRI